MVRIPKDSTGGIISWVQIVCRNTSFPFYLAIISPSKKATETLKHVFAPQSIRIVLLRFRQSWSMPEITFKPKTSEWTPVITIDMVYRKEKIEQEEWKL